MADAEKSPSDAHAVHDLVTGRHQDAAGREHDLVTEATVGADPGVVTDPDDDVVTDATVGPDSGTGVVNDRGGR